MSNVDKILEVLSDNRLQLLDNISMDQAARLLQVFLQQWSRWNPKINLTSECRPEAVIENHIFDSLQYARVVTDPQGQVMDIGSGAGFPGIPLKVIFPELSLALVESQRKRASFLRTCVREMGLKQVAVHNLRAEEITSDHHGRFDLVLFRAVGELSHCLALAAPFLKMGGRVCIKKETAAEAPPPVEGEGFVLALKEEIAIEGKGGKSSKLVLFQKSST